MAPYQRILVPVDFSDCANEVVEQAIELARPIGATIFLVHALERTVGLRRSAPVADSKGAVHSVESTVREAAAKLLPKFVRQARDSGVEADARIVEGLPADVVLDLAKQLPADLIVMGTHGRTGLERLVLGSVAETVLRRADVPVLTVRAKHKPHCEARSCQVCRSGVTDAVFQAEAELEG